MQQNRFAGVAFLLFNTPCSYLESSIITTQCGCDCTTQNKQQPSALVYAAYFIFPERGQCIPEPPTNPTFHSTGIFVFTTLCSWDDCVSQHYLFPIWNTLQRKQRCWCFSCPLLSLCETQSHIPELETPLSERVRAFLDWLQDNRAFSSMIHVVK